MLLTLISQVAIIEEMWHNAQFGPDSVVSDDTLVSAITKIISRCVVENSPAVVCSYQDGMVVVEKVAIRDLGEKVSENLSQFKEKGGLILLIYSAVLTHVPDSSFAFPELMTGNGVGEKRTAIRRRRVLSNCWTSLSLYE